MLSTLLPLDVRDDRATHLNCGTRGTRPCDRESPRTMRADAMRTRRRAHAASSSSGGGGMRGQQQTSHNRRRQTSCSRFVTPPSHPDPRGASVGPRRVLSVAHPAGAPPSAPNRSGFSLLRRKGRLKEQDDLIDLMIEMHRTHSSLEVMQKMQRWIAEHRQNGRTSNLRRLVPNVGYFATDMDLVAAIHEYDAMSSLMERKYVPPNFAEIRHIMNIAQVHGIAPNLQLVSFDADGTLYEDGKSFTDASRMIDLIVSLLEAGVTVAVITAAGYPPPLGNARYEERFAGLLRAFERRALPKAMLDRFFVMGGECNYLLTVDASRPQTLRYLPKETWMSDDMLAWADDDIKRLLDHAEALLVETATRLNVDVSVIRKERAVGVVSAEPTNERANEPANACEIAMKHNATD